MKLRSFLPAALIALVVIVAASFNATAQSTVKNYFSGCQGANCDNVGTFGGTINVPSGGVLNIKSGGAIQNDGVAINLTDSGVTNAVAGVAASYKVARGETALDGSNPTPVTTGLTTITGCSLTIKTTSAPGVSTSVLTYGSSSGTMNMYGWKVTGTGDATLIASAGTDTIGWVCVGT